MLQFESARKSVCLPLRGNDSAVWMERGHVRDRPNEDGMELRRWRINWGAETEEEEMEKERVRERERESMHFTLMSYSYRFLFCLFFFSFPPGQ